MQPSPTPSPSTSSSLTPFGNESGSRFAVTPGRHHYLLWSLRSLPVKILVKNRTTRGPKRYRSFSFNSGRKTLSDWRSKTPGKFGKRFVIKSTTVSPFHHCLHKAFYQCLHRNLALSYSFMCDNSTPQLFKFCVHIAWQIKLMVKNAIYTNTFVRQITVESHYFELRISRTSHCLDLEAEHGLVSVYHCNFTLDISNPRYLEPFLLVPRSFEN